MAKLQKPTIKGRLNWLGGKAKGNIEIAIDSGGKVSKPTVQRGKVPFVLPVSSKAKSAQPVRLIWTDESTRLQWDKFVKREEIKSKEITLDIPSYVHLPEFQRHVEHIKSHYPKLKISKIKDTNLTKIETQTGIIKDVLTRMRSSAIESKQSGVPESIHYVFNLSLIHI